MSGAVDDDDRDLAAAQAGDHGAFARLYDRHAPVVLSLCRRSIHGSLAEAEDATQETFLRAYRMLDRVHDAGGIRAWLYSIARHVASERRRSAGRRLKREQAAMREASTLDHARVSHDSPAEEAHRAESLERLGDAIERLDDRERLAVHLYYLENDPVRAAFDALGLSRSGYYKLLARARERLAVLMREVQPS